MRGFVIAAALVTVAAAAPAAAEPLPVVVRDAGAPLAVARLRGQLADLDVTVRVESGPLEGSLDAQLATAARLAEADGARAVVWFVPRGRGLAVAIATPGDHRLFVRDIPAADASAVAEAAAVAARGALKAIAQGGTIGVEVPRTEAAEAATDREPPPAHAAPPPPREHVDEPAAPARTAIEAALGWQAALDGGADDGAHALAQRTTVAHGPWAVSLALTLGLPLRRTTGEGVALELSRSGGAIGVERRYGMFALGASAGALLYHRTTVAAPDGLAPTPGATTVAFVGGPEVSWRWRPRGGHVGVAAWVGLDVVAGAPELVVARSGMVESLGALHALQARFALSIYAGLP